MTYSLHGPVVGPSVHGVLVPTRVSPLIVGRIVVDVVLKHNPSDEKVLIYLISSSQDETKF